MRIIQGLAHGNVEPALGKANALLIRSLVLPAHVIPGLQSGWRAVKASRHQFPSPVAPGDLPPREKIIAWLQNCDTRGALRTNFTMFRPLPNRLDLQLAASKAETDQSKSQRGDHLSGFKAGLGHQGAPSVLTNPFCPKRSTSANTSARGFTIFLAMSNTECFPSE